MILTHRLSSFLLLALFLDGCVAAPNQHTDFTDVCRQISQEISNASEVFYPEDNEHWATSSSQASACSVEPGAVQDLAKIVKILGTTRTPFGVKSGGHATNPGFSSTPGVQITMFRFNEVTYRPESQTAVIGSGLIFDDVYARLAPNNVSVLGGRVSEIGVGGFLLGGGYAWHTNQRGLAVDTILAYELVKPNGEVATVTEASDPELFFGLKGVVTRFTMKAFPQGPVWGGLITYLLLQIPDVTTAFIKFVSTATDPKASLINAYNSFSGQPVVSLLLFYDGPSPPSGMFDDFLSIPAASQDISTRSLFHLFSHLLRIKPLGRGQCVYLDEARYSNNLRGVFHTVPLVSFTPRVLDTIFNESMIMGMNVVQDSGILVSYAVEPFLPTILSHNTSPTAYPPTRNQAFYPFNIFYSWTAETFDNTLLDSIRASSDRIRDVVVGIDPSIADAPLYPNYAIFDTPLQKMYGENVDRLKALKARVDPNNVMGLAGGFKF
ncbi:hypothetical protein AMATHDRAFT_77602 [Amanita thiersii Skay4041]|uniref:FAD-binding PCMH-type domain-containing protein n=1 Tax=Amanita thiersii Skay4041 TaxID=703135 RepID=A0A2A9N7S8_9AGAR|nr:hypothetical protein AMATHDRAFT_77602 [Amanita thiersii Skay4041]